MIFDVTEKKPHFVINFRTTLAAKNAFYSVKSELAPDTCPSAIRFRLRFKKLSKNTVSIITPNSI